MKDQKKKNLGKDKGILYDLRHLTRWYLRKRKDRRQGKEYIFTRDDFLDLARLVHLVNWMMPRFSHKDWFKKSLHGFFGTAERPKSHSRVIPLNAEVDKSKNAVIPYQLIDGLIDDACFRIILDECLCRKGMDCKDYPIDLGCLMMGEGARVLLKGNHGREVSAEEAKKHIREAEKHGLVPFAAHALPEEKTMGVPKNLYRNFLEICLCCPCCCIAMKNLKYYPPSVHKTNFVNVAFVARALPDCTGCNKCVSVCPAEAIEVDGDKVLVVEDKCIGCGICQNACEYDSIKLVQTGKSKGGLLDYFEGVNLDLS